MEVHRAPQHGPASRSGAQRGRMGPMLPEPVPGLQEVLLPLVLRCWSCPLVSRAVKEGLEPRVDVKAISKLCDSFCSWDTGPVEQSMCVRPSSLAAFIFLVVCSEVVGETRRLVVEKQEAFIPRLLSGAWSTCSIFLFREGRAIEDGVTANAVCALPSR